MGGEEPPAQGSPAGISGAPPPPGQRIVGREERIEYRDQDGNILNEEQVKALEGKVEFKTRYETRTRVIDENGQEIPDPASVAPPHPDVQGVDQSTKQKKAIPVPDEPIPAAQESVEGQKEKEGKAAKPASEGKKMTQEAA
jgi:dolichyl-phosphate-mannose-protein mannosyltransferase